MHDHDQIVQGLDVLHRGGINKELQEVRSILKEVQLMVGLETMVTRCTGEYVGAIHLSCADQVTAFDYTGRHCFMMGTHDLYTCCYQ